MIDDPSQEPNESADFLELCEESGLENIKFSPIQNGPHVALAVEATLDLGLDDYIDLRVWIGMEDGRASLAQRPRTWVEIDGETYPYGTHEHMFTLLADFPDEIADELRDAIGVAIRIMHDANHDLEYARTMAVSFIADQLNDAASATWDEDETDDMENMEAFAANCAIDLYRAVTVTEAADAHLGFDINARTVDPTTGTETPLKVFWRTDPESDEFVHCYGIGGAWCPAHDGDEQLSGLMATLPEGSRHHYTHALDHLHQVAHAASGVAQDNLAAAVEAIELEKGPLTEDDVHQLSHQVFASTLVELNPLAWTFSGEPDLPSHEH